MRGAGSGERGEEAQGSERKAQGKQNRAENFEKFLFTFTGIQITHFGMKKTSILLMLTILITSLVSCEHYHIQEEGPEIKNVILMIGDGMGLPAVYAAMTVSETPLNIEMCTSSGLQKTFSYDSYITDSGAAGTAIATGNKTLNGAIGVDFEGNPVKSILEIAEDNGFATGLVSTSAITHATPASFIAHQADRYNYEAIALDFLKTDIDVFIGGGYDHFATRQDGLNLIDSLEISGYEVDTLMNQVVTTTSEKLAGLIAPVNLPYRLDGRGNMLPASSGKAIEILSKNQNGFFLMIEGSQIDWAGHANNAEKLIDETLDFDEAVGKALDFARNEGHTLVIVTADHETGGVTITGGDELNHTVTLRFSTAGHTAVMVPVYAYGPGAEKFRGIYDNTDIFYKIIEAFGFE